MKDRILKCAQTVKRIEYSFLDPALVIFERAHKPLELVYTSLKSSQLRSEMGIFRGKRLNLAYCFFHPVFKKPDLIEIEHCLRFQRFFRGCDDSLEGSRILDSHVGKSFAVDNHASLGKTVDEAGIGYSFLADGGIDTGYPQAPHIAFFITARLIRMGKGLYHRVFRGLKIRTAAAAETFCEFQDFLAVILSFTSIYCSGHSCSPEKKLTVRQKLLADLCGIALLQNTAMAKISLALGGLLGQDMAKIHLLVLDLTGSGEGETLCGASFGFHLWHDTTTSSFFCFGGERH
jgi:hypothetical protein